MKKYLFCLTLLLGGVACADELADANALYAKKSYPEALQRYTRLANAGNAEAQLHLGEMYMGGEAGAVDLAKSEGWLRKAAAKGSKAAVGALETMKQREARRADLDYWMKEYDGADLKAGKFSCPTPRIPAVSKQNAEIDAVGARIATWQECYNGFVQNLNDASPLTKRIPADVAKLYTKEEMVKVTEHLDNVRANVAENARVSSQMILADFTTWRSATEKWVNEHNEIVRSTPSAERTKELEARKNNYAPGK